VPINRKKIRGRYMPSDIKFRLPGETKTFVKDRGPFSGPNGWREETPVSNSNTDRFFCGEDLSQNE
jgi:hypothetical protein